jgi:hypothetical protein
MKTEIVRLEPMHGLTLLLLLGAWILLIAVLCLACAELPEDARGLRTLMVGYVIVLTLGFIIFATHWS